MPELRLYVHFISFSELCKDSRFWSGRSVVPHTHLLMLLKSCYLALACLQDTMPVSIPGFRGDVCIDIVCEEIKVPVQEGTLISSQTMSVQIPQLKPPTYKLRGMVNHGGSHMGDKSAIGDKWHLGNDNMVNRTEYDGAPFGMPYLLFYRRKDCRSGA